MKITKKMIERAMIFLEIAGWTEWQWFLARDAVKTVLRHSDS
jgi:hypothetical protein